MQSAFGIPPVSYTHLDVYKRQAIILVLVVFVVVLQDGERRIAVQYSQKVMGRRTYGGQSTNIPLKVNTAGVIPIIFASSLMQFPIVIATFAGKGNGTGIGSEILRGLNQGNWCNPQMPQYSWGLAVYIILTVFFAYFYTSITFNPLEIANNMKKNGGFIPGIRPGKPTVEYLTKILNYIIFVGACGLVLIQLVPIIFNGWLGASAVSYTHLDVYKRQVYPRTWRFNKKICKYRRRYCCDC